MSKLGRPRIEINKDQFERLCGLQCTLEEIASFFKCSEDTIERWCKREYEDEDGKAQTFADVYKKHSATGKMSLRRWQFRSAESGNVTMQIWLGKQYLGQKDEQEIAITNTDAQNQFAEILEIWTNEMGE